MTITSFIKNKEFLQPKKELADYVESEYKNILVPKRYSDNELFDKIKKNNDPNIILRSEHPFELRGDSGIFNSFKFTYLDEYFDFKNKIIKKLGFNFFNLKQKKKKIISEFKSELIDEIFTERINDYSKIKGINKNFLKGNLTFSNWKLIKGINGMILRDDIIENKYHIIMNDKFINSYFQLENGFISKNFGFDKPYYLVNIEKLIGVYNNLVDKNDCAMIEFEVDNKNKDNIYFLQYHKSRDFGGIDFELSKQDMSGKNKIELDFVRGGTPKTGLEVHLNSENSEKDNHYMEMSYSNLENEINLKNRTVEVYGVGDNFHRDIINGHAGRSMFFKPKLSVATIFYDKLYTSDEYYKRIDSGFDVKIVSDGNKGYITRLD